MSHPNRVTSDDDNAGLPTPLVLGDCVYHWHFWDGELRDVVITPRFIQLIVQLVNGTELVVKDHELVISGEGDLRAGNKVMLAGLGDRTEGNQCYFCGLVDLTQHSIHPLVGWLNHIDWTTANEYFGWRTRREAMDCVRKYYAAMFEVLLRVSAGPLGAAYEREVLPAAETAMRKWSFTF